MDSEVGLGEHVHLVVPFRIQKVMHQFDVVKRTFERDSFIVEYIHLELEVSSRFGNASVTQDGSRFLEGCFPVDESPVALLDAEGYVSYGSEYAFTSGFRNHGDGTGLLGYGEDFLH